MTWHFGSAFAVWESKPLRKSASSMRDGNSFILVRLSSLAGLYIVGLKYLIYFFVMKY